MSPKHKGWVQDFCLDEYLFLTIAPLVPITLTLTAPKWVKSSSLSSSLSCDGRCLTSKVFSTLVDSEIYINTVIDLFWENGFLWENGFGFLWENGFLWAILHWRWSLRCETWWEIHSKAWDVRGDEKSIPKPEMWDVMRSPF